MKNLFASTTLMILFLSVGYSYQIPMHDKEYLEGYSLLGLVEKSTIVVLGTVADMEYHYRENVTPSGRGSLTTDIIIDIETLIKGKPNAGRNRVIFMIEGGIGTYPGDTEPLRLLVGGEPEFEIDERVMVFLVNDIDDSYYRNYPHGKLFVNRAFYGKREVVDDIVSIWYVKGDEVFGFEFEVVDYPLDLAVNLSLAYIKDKETAIKLEDEINNLVQDHEEVNASVKLSDEFVERLLKETEKILKPNSDRSNEIDRVNNEESNR